MERLSADPAVPPYWRPHGPCGATQYVTVLPPQRHPVRRNPCSLGGRSLRQLRCCGVLVLSALFGGGDGLATRHAIAVGRLFLHDLVVRRCGPCHRRLQRTHRRIRKGLATRFLHVPTDFRLLFHGGMAAGSGAVDRIDGDAVVSLLRDDPCRHLRSGYALLLRWHPPAQFHPCCDHLVRIAGAARRAALYRQRVSAPTTAEAALGLRLAEVWPRYRRSPPPGPKKPTRRCGPFTPPIGQPGCGRGRRPDRHKAIFGDLNLGDWRTVLTHVSPGPGGFDVTAPSS